MIDCAVAQFFQSVVFGGNGILPTGRPVSQIRNTESYYLLNNINNFPMDSKKEYSKQRQHEERQRIGT